MIKSFIIWSLVHVTTILDIVRFLDFLITRIFSTKNIQFARNSLRIHFFHCHTYSIVILYAAISSTHCNRERFFFLFLSLFKFDAIINKCDFSCVLRVATFYPLRVSFGNTYNTFRISLHVSFIFNEKNQMAICNDGICYSHNTIMCTKHFKI